jgi:uncharacterized membrane protein
MKNLKLTDYRVLLRLQSIYFIVTGIWPLISMKTFLIVTGPKTDLWLVQTVGILILVIGLTLLYASIHRVRNSPIIFLAIASSLALAIVDITFYLNGTIGSVYLLDAGLEFLLILLWIVNIYKNKNQRPYELNR